MGAEPIILARNCEQIYVKKKQLKWKKVDRIVGKLDAHHVFCVEDCFSQL